MKVKNVEDIKKLWIKIAQSVTQVMLLFSQK
jgi:hypothetical protein